MADEPKPKTGLDDVLSLEATYYATPIPQSMSVLTILGAVFDKVYFPGVMMPIDNFDQEELDKEIGRIEGLNVVLVEDILDTGLTLSYLIRVLQQRRPKTLHVAALLDKPSRRIKEVKANYVGFTIPNEFVVGYGLDYAERYRNLKDVCVLSLPAE